MSKISLSPNASGTGTFTIQSPAGDINRTFTLPDKDGELGVGGGGFTYVAVSGATQDLDLDEGNFFDAGTLTADTTITFSNVGTEANWRYSFVPEVFAGSWDVVKSAHIKESPTLSEDPVPQGLFFKPDGTKVYTTGWHNDKVHEYDLSKAWDVTTVTFVQSFSVVSQDNQPYGLFFKPDGTKMYVAGDQNNIILEYALSTAWDISTASYTHGKSIYAQESAIRDIFFKPDGTKLYFPGNTGDDITEFNLSTAWDVSTASHVTQFSVSAQTSEPSDVFFKPDGTEMFVLDKTNRYVLKYDLSTAWSISTASYGGNSTSRFQVNLQELSPEGMFFKPDGSRMFIIGASGDDITEYSVGDISVVTFPDSVLNTSDITDTVVGQTYFYEFLTIDGGTTVKLIGEEIV